MVTFAQELLLVLIIWELFTTCQIISHVQGELSLSYTRHIAVPLFHRTYSICGSTCGSTCSYKTTASTKQASEERQKRLDKEASLTKRQQTTAALYDV